MNVADVVERRGIDQVIHFTTNRGLVGMLFKAALLSRPLLRSDELLVDVAYPNTKFRQEELSHFDKKENWIDYVNLSISEPNHSFFDVSRRWHMKEDIYWVVLAFDPEILSHDDVVFTTTNNVYKGCIRGGGEAGLEALFAQRVHRKETWWATRTTQTDRITTCEQAEVLYRNQLDAKHLRKVYVGTHSDMIRTRGTLAECDRRDVEVVIDPFRCGIR